LPLLIPRRPVGSVAPASRPKADASSIAKRRLSTMLLSPPPLMRGPVSSVCRTQASPFRRIPQSGVKASFSV